MQILANALPGFRDLRAPIVAGYLWLVFLWLILHPDLDTRPEDTIGAALYDLGEHVGRVGIAISASVVAYFVGSLSQVISPVLRAGWSPVLEYAWYVLPFGLDRAIGIPGSPQPPEEEEIQQLADRLGAALTSVYRLLPDDPRAPDVASVADRADAEARAELALPATLLVGKEPELFAEVDRLRAEGDLRLSVVPPFVALVILMAGASAWWLVALLPLLALLDQGVRRLNSSRQLVADAKARGLVPSLALERFRKWSEAVEADPLAAPPPPWQAHDRPTRRLPSPEARRRVAALSRLPYDPALHLSLVQGLSPHARNLLREFARDELRYASKPNRGMSWSRLLERSSAATADLLKHHGLIERLDRADRDSSWVLTDEGIGVASLLTAPLPSDPDQRALLEALD